MPSFKDDVDLQTMKTPNGYSFSAIRGEDVESSEITLVTIVCDVSGSVSSFRNEIIECLKTIFNTCNDNKNPRRENLMMRLVTFSSNVQEIHGYNMLSCISPDSYDSSINIHGMTALYDGAYTTIDSALTYSKELSKQGIMVNAINFVITDGADNASKFSPSKIKTIVDKSKQDEYLESILNILIGIDTSNSSISSYLKQLETEAGFDQFIDIASADKKSLLKLAQFVSQSISSQSQALNSGGPSKLLTF